MMGSLSHWIPESILEIIDEFIAFRTYLYGYLVSNLHPSLEQQQGCYGCEKL
jgi:hypothetical protein